MKKDDEVFEIATSGKLNFMYVEDYKEALYEVVQEALEQLNYFGDDITSQRVQQEENDNCGVTIALESRSKGNTCNSGNSGGGASETSSNSHGWDYN